VKKRQTIRDHSAEANLFARRTFVSMLFVVIFLSLIIVNLYHLQVNQFEDYQTRSNGNRIKVLPIAPNRGLIYDRNGVILAENKPVFTLEIVPEDVENLDETLAQLTDLMSLTTDELDDFQRDRKRQRRFKPVTLRKQLSQEDVAIFAANQYRFPGVSIEARLSRYYPFKDTLTHMLGYVARINKRDLNKLQENGEAANYAATHDIGKQGVEKYHEQTLHGSVGYQQVEVNNQGRIIRVLDLQPPIPGKDIALNIDIELQKQAQLQLAGRRGSVVITDTRDGGVLALYSSPSYDPNLFVHGISQKEYSKLLNSNHSPLLNRATQGRYPPASTVKPFLALAGLEDKTITPEYTIKDNGTFRLPNVSHVWRDWKKWGHGDVDVTRSLEVSCNTFYYELASKLGIDRINEYMTEFGFGQFTGIDLYEESSAILPSRGWKRARFNEPWYVGDTISVGIGQGYWSATPLQLAQSLTFLVNKGQRHVPRLMRGYMVEGNVDPLPVEMKAPIPIIDETNWHVILDAMYGTANRPDGTALRAFEGTDYIAAGKTGTAQLFTVAQDEEYEVEEVSEELRNNAVFIGFAPYDSPQISVAVAIENAGGGGANAAPVARNVMDFYFGSQANKIAQANVNSEETAEQDRMQ
jgi:penicillin-binding protein 2